MHNNGTLQKKQTGPNGPTGYRGCRKSLLERNRKIIAMRDSGMTYKEIAKEYSMTHQAIQRIYKTYKSKI